MKLIEIKINRNVLRFYIESLIKFLIAKRAYVGYISNSEVMNFCPLSFIEFKKLHFSGIISSFKFYLYYKKRYKYNDVNICFRNVVFNY